MNYQHGGLNRSYYLYLPDSISMGAPLVFVLHGFTGTAQGIMTYSGMNDIADDHQFVVCYPQGRMDSNGNTFWNVGYDFHQDQTVDDLGFLVELAHYLQSEYNLSRNNTFATGMSNGGEMSYLLACNASDGSLYASIRAILTLPGGKTCAVSSAAFLPGSSLSKNSIISS